MREAGPAGALRERLRAPFQDREFRRLLVCMGAWIVAADVAAPFLTVYLIEQREFLTAQRTGWRPCPGRDGPLAGARELPASPCLGLPTQPVSYAGRPVVAPSPVETGRRVPSAAIDPT